MQEILRVVVGIIILSGLLWLIESLWPENRYQRKWHSESRTNLFFLIFDTTISKVIVGFFVLIAIGLLFLFAPRTGLSWVGKQPLILQGLEMLLIGGFFDYWMHRIGHKVKFLWRFHSIHHSAKNLDWMAAGRVHPVDSIALTLANLIPLYLLGFSANGLAFYAPFLAIYPIVLHANVSWSFGPLRYIIASPAYHRWHHSSDVEALDKNFSGLFPFYDFIFGTLYFPRDVRPRDYGLYQASVPQGIWQQLMYPFRKPETRQATAVRR